MIDMGTLMRVKADLLMRSTALTMCVGVVFLLMTGCQTQRQISFVQEGMTEAEVLSVFGKPDAVEAGEPDGNGLSSIWYYNAYANQPYEEWVYVPRGREYGGDLKRVPTSRGRRYRKFRVTFFEGTVYSATQLAPPEF